LFNLFPGEILVEISAAVFYCDFEGGNMTLLKETEESVGALIPVIGIESSPESFTEPTKHKYSQIAERAYFKSEARGFEPGYEEEDWLEAENELTKQ
jgi:hypothetical protein